MCERPTQMSGSGRESSRKSGNGRKALSYVWEWSGVLPDARERLGGPLVSPGVVGRPSRMSGNGREALPDFREWSGDPPGCAGVSPGFPSVVGRPSWMTRSGLETLSDVREVHPDVREVIPDVQEWSGGPPGYLGEVERPPGGRGVVGRPS